MNRMSYNDWLEYAKKIPDVGYTIGLAETRADELRIEIDESNVDMPTVVKDFQEALDKSLPYPIGLRFDYRGNTIIIHPQLTAPNRMQDAFRFLQAYKAVLEEQSERS